MSYLSKRLRDICDRHAASGNMPLLSIDELRSYADLIDQQAAEIEALRAGLIAVQCLIDKSEGVYGLHFNGDTAPWDELLEGGRYEDWLVDFSTALRGDE